MKCAQTYSIHLTRRSQILKHEQEFNKDVENLGKDMHSMLSCLAHAQRVADQTPTMNAFRDILRCILEAAKFIDEHLRRSRLGERP